MTYRPRRLNYDMQIRHNIDFQMKFPSSACLRHQPAIKATRKALVLNGKRRQIEMTRCTLSAHKIWRGKEQKKITPSAPRSAIMISKTKTREDCNSFSDGSFGRLCNGKFPCRCMLGWFERHVRPSS